MVGLLSLVSIENLGYGIIAVNKPPGLVTHIDRDHPEEAIDKFLKDNCHGFMHVNRIDKHTSGWIIAARTKGIERRLEAMVPHRWLTNHWHTNIRKIYLAVIEAPDWNKDVMICDEEVWVDGKPKSAETKFVVIRESEGKALVACELLKNGRTHQIRYHLRHLEHPIIGDVKYGSRIHSIRGGQLLHSYVVKIRLPNDFLVAVAPVHQHLLEGFNWKHEYSILGDVKREFNV